MEYVLTAGQTYYLGVKWNDSNSSGTVPILLTLGEHSYTKNESGQFVCTCGVASPYSITLDQSLDVDVPAGEIVRIPFEPEYTHEYVFRSTLSSGDTYGYIYDAEGKQLVSNDDSGGSGQFKITYTLNAGKTYYLGVKWLNSSNSGTIPVLLTYGNHWYTKNESGQYVCSCGLAAPYSITLNQSLDVNVPAGETVTIPFVPEYTHGYIFRSTSSGGATYGCIYDADGKQLTSGYGWGGKFRMEYVLTAGQTYYLGVKWDSASNSGTIPVLLTSGNHLYTKNESGQFVCACGAASPYSITLDQSLDVNVPAGETVTIPFVPEYTHEYIFQSTDSGNPTDGYIYDANGNSLYGIYGGNGQFRIAYTLTAGETYYLGVKWDSASNSGTIPVLLALGGHTYTQNESGQYACTCGVAGIILDEGLSVNIAAAWETVKIPFEPQYTHEYVFRSTLSSGDPYGYIFDADGNQLASDDISGGNNQFKITYTLTAGETYYFGVKWDNSNSSGMIPVLLTLGEHSYTKNESGQLVCACGEAGIILNQSMDVDVPSRKTVKIPFEPEYTHEYIFRSTLSSGDTYGYIYDAEGKELVSDDDSGGNGQFKITYTLTAGQTYYLGVKWDYSNSSGTIPVLLTLGEHSYTKNESGQFVCACGSAGITLNQSMDVDVPSRKTVKIPFEPEYTHKYIFQSTGSGNATYGYIYDANGNQLTGSYGGNGQFKITYTLTAGQTYYLGVRWSSSSNSGTIPVLLTYGDHSYTKNESGQFVCACGAIAPSITLNQSLDVDVPAGEIVRIPFEPEYTHEYIFRSTGTGGTYGHLYDADGNRLTSSSGGSSGQFKITYTLNAGETYYLGVKWYSSSSSGTIPVLLTYGAHSYAMNESGQYVCTCGATGIAVNQSLKVEALAGETVKLPFVPEYTHEYVFQSTGSGNATYGYIFDANGNQLTSSYGGNGQFKITYTLTAGQTYYLGVRWAYSSDSGTIPVLLTLGGHTYTQNESGQFVCVCGAASPYSITLDKSLDVNVPAGEIVRIPFVPEYTHEYVFRSTLSSGDTYGYIYDSEGKQLVFDDDSGGNRQFMITYTLNAGETYYLGVKWLNSSNSGTIPVLLTYGEHFYSRNESGQYACTCGLLAQGTCGDGVTWRYENGALIISGSEAMQDYEGNNTPWETLKKDITSVRVEEGVTGIGTSAFENCGSLTSVTIPKSVQTVGDKAFSGCSELEELVWNAENATLTYSDDSKTGSFTLVIGQNVDNIDADTFAGLAKMGAAKVQFTGPNRLTLQDNQADAFGLPLSRLPAGTYYVDGQGVLYRIHDGVASLAYCPPELTQYTVPGELPSQEGGAPIPVTGVDSYAFAAAQELTAITFAKPENITELKDFAFANANNLASINGADSEAEVLATFTGTPDAGMQLFENTRITQLDHNPTGVDLQIEKNNVHLIISTEMGEKRSPAMADNTYQYYTGEAATSSITISNPDSSSIVDGTIIRVIYKFDRAGGSLTFNPGSYNLVAGSGNSYRMTVSKSPVPYCYVVDIERPRQGDTLGVNIGSVYPSPTSAGGNVLIWGGILTKEEAAAQGSTLLPPSGDYHRINWSTKPDTFPVTKNLSSSGSAVMKSDGKGGAYISGLSYRITMSRSGQTLEGIGKDYVTSVDFRDVLTLPEGAELAPEVIEAVRTGTYRVAGTSSLNFRIGNDTFLTLSLPYAPTTKSLELDENNNLVLKWTLKNADLGTEISTLSCTYSISEKYVLVSEIHQGNEYEVRNQVTATQHYMHSEDQVQSAECQVNVAVSEGKLDFDKSLVGGSRSGYFGDQDYLWRITASNPGVLPYERLAYIEDELPDGLWLSGNQLAALFAADKSHQLTVTISRATICEPHVSQVITGIDGESTGSTSLRNTGAGTPYNGLEKTDSDPISNGNATITLSWGSEDKLLLTLGEGEPQDCAADGTAIQAVLERFGFLVTRDTRYKLCWDLRDENGNIVPLVGGASIVKEIRCSMKDTFMLLYQDQRNRYPTSESIYTSNAAYAYDNVAPNSREVLKSDSDYVYRSREFSLVKGWSWNGEAVKPDSAISQGDVVSYSLTVQHSGTGSYDVLPLVDHMTGGQALLVPAAKNAGKAWAADCEIIPVEGTEYYLLTEPGTYDHVWTSNTQMADTVTVTKTNSGYDTLMKWYFTNYTGSRTDTVRYQAYVCPDQAVPGALVYSLDNESWLNDHTTHRLYDDVGWYGTSFDFDKKIVERVGDTGAGKDYSVVHEGETVIYRLMLDGGTDWKGNAVRRTLTSIDMYDTLPLSISQYRWSRENVHIFYQEESDDYHVENGDSWDIDTASESDQQLLKWGEGFSITFRGRANIYVTLDFPKEVLWQDYAARYGDKTLINTYNVLNDQRSVTHELSVRAKAYLQKGVYSTGYGSSYNIWKENCRLYYNNDDIQPRFVRYYVSLYNGGTTNLYLTDMQDRLPRGFTLSSCDSYSTTGSSYAAVYRANGTMASLKQTSISRSTCTVEGTQYVTFHFSRTSGDSSVRYDESRNMCYLAPGEAIKFTYTCRTNQAADTDDEALNTITMPYYDYNGGGVAVDTDCEVVVENSGSYTPNDGRCEEWNDGQVKNAGFTGKTTDTQWLTSQVKVLRGGIKPGITKALTSATTTGGDVTQNPASAFSTDTLTWTVTAENDGSLSVTDYVLTDVMQKPYGFIGKVNYQVYASGGSLVGYTDNGYLFEVVSADEAVMYISYQGTKKAELVIGGDPVEIPVQWRYGFSAAPTIGISVSRDGAGNVVMSIHFPKEMAIPEYGKGVLTLSTKNETNTLENRQFVNAAFITPLTQTWETGTNKGNMTTLTTPFSDIENLDSVRNSAPVTTAFGYMTSSGLRITEVGNPENTAASTDDPNYIVLEHAGKQFTYTLTVENTTKKAMEKLILIDNLPETRDHSSFLNGDPRSSEFKVSLAEGTTFTVTITAKDETVTTLDPSQYTIEFSDKTEFDANDWNGSSEWDQSSGSSTRSVRLKISDDTGTLIPAESTISLRFTSRIEGDAEAGAAAWNSFGYHYRLNGDLVDLEAAPLKVGVKVPSVPKLKKQIVDHQGKEMAIKETADFSFLVYQGTALTGNYDTEEALTAALNEGNIPFRKYTVSVHEGKSQSEPVSLEAEGWTWTKDQKYTVTELPCGEKYMFSSFGGSTGASYTFTYNPSQTQTISCNNAMQNWAVTLTKVNTDEEILSGAVFALYSLEEKDKISEIPEEYQELSIAQTLERDDKTWYLKAVGTTGEDGKLTFGDLLREAYYLVEVKPPVGYNISDTNGRLLEQKYESQGVYEITVVNRRGVELPKTGGIGINTYAMGGMLLIQCALISLMASYKRAPKKKERKQQ